jgi:hypothetical protein
MEIVGAPVAPLIHALLAQLVAHRDSAGHAPALLVAVEADAARRLVEQLGVALPLGLNTRMLLQAADIAHAERLISTGQSTCPMVAIGPQAEASARSLSERAGRCVAFGPIPNSVRRWRGLLLPGWVKQEVERLPAEALKAALPTEALLLAPDQRPVRMRVLIGGGATRFTAPSEPARHDWPAPPADLTQTPQAPVTDAAALVRPGPPATKLRRVLTRAAAKPANNGARKK